MWEYIVTDKKYLLPLLHTVSKSMWSVSLVQDTPKPPIIQSNHLLFCPMQPILVDQNRPSLKPVYFLNGIQCQTLVYFCMTDIIADKSFTEQHCPLQRSLECTLSIIQCYCTLFGIQLWFCWFFYLTSTTSRTI